MFSVFHHCFQTGKYGQFYHRDVKLQFSEYVKSRLFNKDSRFRKNPEFVFYNLWVKEMRELSSGIYSTLKSGNRVCYGITARDFLQGIESSDQQVEANLITMFQSVRGSKQYWYLRHSEALCMIREWGSPALFLTLSCAEYDSPEISRYLHKVNDVPDNCPIGKLCTEDPILVTQKFDQKFKTFFSTIILNGQALGKISHYFIKKEYQARGAPHYRLLLWIDDALIIGKDPDSKVLEWIQQRITCHIPEEKSNPELHRLATKYQMHKCSAYCKRKRKFNNAFITQCKFGFP